jgi:pSer/pThr/pTyr-binding forkhead associated (FHA) protein
MAGNEHTRFSTGGPAPDDGRPVSARLTIDRRMGRPVQGESITILFGSQMLVGRDRTCEIFVNDDRISRKHAIIRIDHDTVRLSDLGSTNGTTRNSEPVTDEIIVESGDRICMGRAITYEVRTVIRDGAIGSVRLASGADGYLLAPQELIIGFADPKNDDVDLKLYDPSILPRHARIEFFTGMTFIVSLDPDKPVVVNSSPVREIEIRNSYLIEIGDTLLRWERL